MDIPSALAVALVVLFIKMYRVPAYDDAPRLLVDRRRPKANGFQRIEKRPRRFGNKRRIEAAGIEQGFKREPRIRLDTLAHNGLPHGHFFGRVAEGADAGHDLAVPQVHGPFKRGAVHGSGDPRGADTPRFGEQHDLFKGIAEGLLRMGNARHLPGDKRVRPDDDGAFQPLPFRVQQLPRDGNIVGGFKLFGEGKNRRGVLRRQGCFIKGAHAAPRTDTFQNVHLLVSPFFEGACV